MKIGFQINIQENLTPVQEAAAQEFADEFISKTIAHPQKKYSARTQGGWRSYLKRGTAGMRFHNNELLFRRISNTKRIFGIVSIDTVAAESGLNLKEHCMCPAHAGGEKVKWVNGEPQMKMYCVYRDVQG